MGRKLKAILPNTGDLVAGVYCQALAEARAGCRDAVEFLDLAAPDWRERCNTGVNTMNEYQQDFNKFPDLIAVPTPGSMTATLPAQPQPPEPARLTVKVIEYSQAPPPKPPRPIEQQPLPGIDELAKLIEEEPDLHRVAWDGNFDLAELRSAVRRSSVLRGLKYKRLQSSY